MLQLHNQFGQVDLKMIDPAEVAKLSEPQISLLDPLVKSVETREAAQERVRVATVAVLDASREYDAALAANNKANPPLSPDEAHRASIASYRATH
jgi:hypothetical protein